MADLCLCAHARWLHISDSEGRSFRGRCVGEHRVSPRDLPDDIVLTTSQMKSIRKRGYAVLECSCRMFHTVVIPDEAQLVDPAGRAIHSNGGGS